MFYSSRPLPNFVMTLPLTNIVLSLVLLNRFKWAIFLCAFTAIIFRLEVAGLGVGLTLLSIYIKKISLSNAIAYGGFGVSIGAAFSLLIDSYFWKESCVPEVDAFIFNVISGQASKWGTESPIAYFTHYIRMMFIPPTVLLLNYFGFKLAPTNLKIISLAAYFHIFIMSFQPHKEWRFIIYAIPPIMLLGSTAAAYLWENFKVDSFGSMALLGLLPLSPVLSAIFSMTSLYISSLNYPGGEALATFNQYILNQNVTNATVHISVPPCMTGVTLFGQLYEDQYGITYDRTENEQELKQLWPSFDYLITHEPSPEYLPQFDKNKTLSWEIVDSAKMFTGFNMTYVNELFFQEDQNALSLITNTLLKSDAMDYVLDVIDHVLLKTDVFFIYKRIKEDSDMQA